MPVLAPRTLATLSALTVSAGILDPEFDTDTTYTYTGLAPGDTRHYRVSARNALGPGDPSDTDQATTLSGGICARTAQVRDAIVAEVMEADASVTTCADVTPAHLTSLDRSTWDLTSQNISSLKPGDFAGLTSLYDLILERNALSSLPAGIFDPLTALEALRLGGNTLTNLRSGLFDPLTALTLLELTAASLTSLSRGKWRRMGRSGWTPKMPVGTRTTGLGCCSTGPCWTMASMQSWPTLATKSWTAQP